MRHRISGRHLGRDTAHRTALYRNLVTDLIRYERLTTTEAKAKEIRPIAERIITLGRKGGLHNRRQALRFVYDTKVVDKLFDEIGPRMMDRPGGYLRVTALEPRKGDGARMAAIEFVDLTGAPATPRPRRVTAAPAMTAAPAAGATPVAVAEEEAEIVEAVEEAEEALAEAEAEAGDEVEDTVETTEAVGEEAPAAETATDEAVAETDEPATAEEAPNEDSPAAEEDEQKES